MRVITSAKDIPKCALALGNFDGLHLAHMRLADDCLKYARAHNLSGGMLIFAQHSKTVTKNRDIKLLTTLDEKLEILESINIDFVYIQEFDEDFMRLSCEEFLAFLKNELNCSAVFAGFDYTFGYEAKGDAKLLEELAQKNGLYAHILDKTEISGKTVSSTMIRELIQNGDVKTAKQYLQRCYEVRGRVVEGKQNGRRLGFPTANVEYDAHKFLPKDGVYFGYAKIRDSKFKCVVNVGTNPTFGAQFRTVEAYIEGFSGSLYGENIKILFEDKIRDEIRFSSPDKLKEQIKRDIKILS